MLDIESVQDDLNIDVLDELHVAKVDMALWKRKLNVLDYKLLESHRRD